MYTIQVTYITGDSFSSREETSEINLVWKDKQLARNALRAIKEHYRFFTQECRSEHNIRDDEWSKLNQFEWFKRAVEISSEYSKKDAKEYAMWLCAAECDNGEWRRISVSMWMGYFERLLEAQVVTTTDINDEEDCVRFY